MSALLSGLADKSMAVKKAYASALGHVVKVTGGGVRRYGNRGRRKELGAGLGNGDVVKKRGGSVVMVTGMSSRNLGCVVIVTRASSRNVGVSWKWQDIVRKLEERQIITNRPMNQTCLLVSKSEKKFGGKSELKKVSYGNSIRNI